MGSTKGPSRPKPQPTIDKEGEEAAERERRRRLQAQGRASTILTPTSLATEPARGAAKYLTGA